MADVHSPETRSYNMSRIHGKDTDGKGYAVCGPKAENMRLELKALLQNYER